MSQIDDATAQQRHCYATTHQNKHDGGKRKKNTNLIAGNTNNILS